MKLISLNTWGSRLTRPLCDYVAKNAKSTDIFCFQEIQKGGQGLTERGEVKSSYEDLSAQLHEFTGYFFAYGESDYYSESANELGFEYGIACFVRNKWKQSFCGGATLYDPDRKWSDYTGNFAAGTCCAVSVEGYLVVNVHGLWQGSIKTDTDAKIAQSEIILDLANKHNGKKIICGDFNLLPDTRAIQMFRDSYQDLIQTYDIKDTRGIHYKHALRFADYVFVDKSVTVTNFAVPDAGVSDHLPLEVEFDAIQKSQ